MDSDQNKNTQSLRQKLQQKYDVQGVAKLLLMLIVIFKVSFIFWQFTDNQYLVAPGGDPLSHLWLIKQILNGAVKSFYYPPLFHYIIIFLAKISGADILAIMKNVAFLLLFIPIPILYYVTKKMFGFWPAFWATVLYTLNAGSPLLSFVDGNYPDMLNYGIFIPLAFLFLTKIIGGKEKKYIVYFAIISILMILTHHLTTTFAFLIIFFYFLAIIILGLTKKINLGLSPKLLNKLLLIFIAFITATYLLLRITFGDVIVNGLKSVFTPGSVTGNLSFSQPVSYTELFFVVSPIIWFLGALGLFYLVISIKQGAREKLLIIIWILVIWFISRTQMSGLAPRYLREISVPLCISAGIGIADAIVHLEHRWHKFLLAGLIGFLSYASVVQINSDPLPISHGGFSRMVWYTQSDKEKVDYIANKLPRDTTVLMNPSSPYLSYYLEKNNPHNIRLVIPTTAPDLNGYEPIVRSVLADNFILATGASYILIGNTPFGTPNENSYAQYKGYQAVTNVLNYYKHSKKEEIKIFPDGSRLIVVNF
jgi:hypothetical protein